MSPRTSPNIIQAMESVFSASFERGRSRDTWKAWRAFLAAVFALPMNVDEVAVYRKHTGRDEVPITQFREAFCVVGRRGGKSAIAALIATFLAVFRDYSAILASGETGVVMLLAADRRQARVLLDYINAFFDHVPMLRNMVLSKTQESLTLTNRIRIEVHTTSFRAIRGYTVVAAVCDEVAYWRNDESANPDVEVLNALRPAMSTIPNALLLCISSPYARRGALWDAYKENFGKTGSPVLVWKAATREMNPTVSSSVIEAAYLRDHAAASAEYGAGFRTDVEGFLSLEVIESCVIPDRFELPPLGSVTYAAFVDPSGGASDSMTLAISHRERDRAVLDLLREIKAPFSPESAVREFADTLKRYRAFTLTGDRYAGEWPREQFHKLGITYRTSEKTRSELYLELLPALTSGQAELLDNKRLVSQLVNLERRTSRLGRDSVDHSPGSHDDVANAAAGALVESIGQSVRLTYADSVNEKVAARVTANVVQVQAVCPGCGTACVIRGPLWHCSRCGKEGRIAPMDTPVGPRVGIFDSKATFR
jgi:hypothetical protein